MLQIELYYVLSVDVSSMCKLIEKKVSELKEYENNPRKNDKAVQYLKSSIRDFGFKVPIVIDADDVIVCGHTRLKAAKSLKMKTVPCIIADDLTEEQIKAFRLADNQVAGLSTWDDGKLDAELEALGIDMSAYGFSIGKALQNSSGEINVADFEDEQFDYECPCCGFLFNG